ncbi:MAG: ABC transporter substrate-binding protein, partial [Clostridiales bacterium]
DTAQQFLNGKSAGSGPYIMESYTPDVEIVLKRNENYWGTKPAVETIIIKDVPEANTQLLTLQQGDIDIAFNLNSDQISQIKDDQKLQVITTPTKTIGFLMMNMDPKIGGPMADPKVQQAVRYALDYQGLHTLIGEGTITPASIIQVGFFGALEARDPGYTNLDKAKALLKEAGYESCFNIDMPVCTLAPEGIPLPTIAQKVKEDLSKVNITVNIQTSDWAGGYGDEYRNGTLPFTAMYWAPDYNDPNTQLDFLPGYNVGLRAGWQTAMAPDLAAYYTKITGAKDNAAKEAALKEMQELSADNMPFIPYAQYPKNIAVKKGLQGVEFSNVYRLDLSKLAWAK